MKLQWTEHSKLKMRQYGLSKTKLLQILYKPERKEKGIVDGTTAVMQTKKIYSSPKRVFDTNSPVAQGYREQRKPIKVPGEIWLMYKDSQNERRIISAWRYPGISKPGEAIPMPEEIRRELGL